MSKISEWLSKLGLEEYTDLFVANRIGFDILSEINDSDLKNLNIPIGDRKRLLNAIRFLQLPQSASNSADTNDKLSESDSNDLTERRQLTILFADLVGSTALSDRLGLEDYRSVITDYCECCAQTIQAHGGVVAQYQGDGVLAYFGYPQASEDDAEQAVTTGLTINELVPKIEANYGIQLQTRIGIATGLVVVGDMRGKTISMTGHVTGEIPNLAARLQQGAEPGSIRVNTETRNLLGRRFKCRDLGKHRFKGFDDFIQISEVRAVKQLQSRFEDRQRSNLTLFINREEELELLHRRWGAIKDGRGQIILISGEPGIGKSRLIEEFYKRIKSESNIRLNFQCLPNQQSSPLHPLVAQLEAQIGIGDGDGKHEKLKKLERWTRKHLCGIPHAMQLLSKLLSIPSKNDHGMRSLTPNEFKTETFDLLIRYIEDFQAKKAVIVFFEDLQWIDPTSQEFLDSLIDRLGGWRLFLICSCRPQYNPQWIGDANVTFLNLRRLDGNQSTLLLEEVSQGAKLDSKLETEILTKTEGVPLFIEELTKSVLESDTLRTESGAYKVDHDSDVLYALPTTLIGSLLARIDRIGGAQKVAPYGAAIGRTFSYELLREIVNIEEDELQIILSRLIEAQLLSQRGQLPNATYMFKHALVEDAAYETMPKGKRGLVHSRIATSLERKFPDVANNKPEILAHHFMHASAYEAACASWQNAAILAREHSANTEAISYIRHALRANDLIDDTDLRLSNEIDLREMIYVPLEVVSWGSTEIAENLDRLRQLRDMRGDSEELLSVLHANCSDHVIGGRVSNARAVAQKMLHTSSEDEKDIAIALANRCLGFCDFLSGEFPNAVSHFESTISLASEINHDMLKKHYYANITLVARLMIAWSFVLAGEKERGEKAIQTASQSTEIETDGHSKTYGLSILSSIHQTAGNPELSLQFASQALAFSQELGSSYWEAWAQIMKGWGLTARGAYHQGLGELEDGISKYEVTRARLMMPYARALLADAYCKAGHVSEASAILRGLENGGQFSEIRCFHSLIRRISTFSNSIPKSDDELEFPDLCA